ncbi:hypothetical protein LAZ67_3001433 [Cordylochernes scorpioides]|uniref:DUF5641 domain-containing protein n=1 Tax=Cordylochernes scorpioides TaxID=51811 RepID=A0ABY6KAB6_9ARAC|nr:hypothetical protein LAZ67_3001433 [Cordylochernes scorpioides]
MRFYNEYSGELVQKKEDSDTRAITAGEVVYVGNDSQKRINWPLGLVKKVYPGEDGNCRVAKVRIKSGEIVRPIQRLYPLEIHYSDMEACGVQSNSEIIAYADDITVICWGKNLTELRNTTGKDKGRILDWCGNNKLTVSEEKTKILYLFNSKIAAKIPNTMTANRDSKDSVLKRLEAGEAPAEPWAPRGRGGRVRPDFEGTKAAPSTTKAPQASKIFKGSFQGSRSSDQDPEIRSAPGSSGLAVRRLSPSRGNEANQCGQGYHLQVPSWFELGNASHHIDLPTLWERTLAVHRWRSPSRGGHHQ